jgi:hypothetical protein
MQPKRHPIFRGFVWLFVVGLLTLGFWNRQNILDWWQLRGYEAPVTIASLATDTTMTDKGRKIFYIQRPAVQEKATFYKSCEEGETSIVLGCYKPPRGIFLLQVDDARLAGVEQVTAAHEMLHAAYARLSNKERMHINELVNEAYAHLNNPAISDKVNLYKQSGADVVNELHSILGTEVSQLPPELEAYYGRYFESRQKIVAFSDKYQAVFTERKKRVADLDAQLAQIEKQVTTNNASLSSQEAAIRAEGQRLDKLLQEQKIAGYNQGVAAYNQSLVPFRNLLNQTRNLVEQYKTILAERNQVAQEAQELNKALDSRIDTTVEEH